MHHRLRALIHFGFAITALLLLSSTASAEEAATKGDLVVTVKNLEGTDGHLLVRLFDSEEHFPLGVENAYRTKKVKVTGTSIKVIFKDVPFYTYALVLLHDANDDGSMDFGITGPEEGHGVSRDASVFIGPPPYKDASFKVDAARVETTVHMDY